MKRILIRSNHAALVMKQGELTRVLEAGRHWLGFGEQAHVFDKAQRFTSDMDIDVLLQHPKFAASVTVLEAADHELILVYLNQNFIQVLGAGRYVFWNGLTQYRFLKADTRVLEPDAAIAPQLLERSPLYAHVRSFRVEPHEQALCFVDGQLWKVLNGGTYTWWKNASQVQVLKADMRQLVLELSGQEILTKDKAQLRLTFTVQYRIRDIRKALYESKEYEKQLYVLMQLALREYIGRLSLDELMDSRDRIAAAVLTATSAQVEELGVTLLYCGVKDIILPGDVREIMNQVLIAEKRAQANIITRREETASARSLLNTAKLMEENTMLYKLKEMEYLERIAEKISSISVSGGGQVLDQLKQLFVKT